MVRIFYCTFAAQKLDNMMRYSLFQRFILFLTALVVTNTLVAQESPWAEPVLVTHEGLPPTDDYIFLYNVGREGFLAQGNAWGTHAMLTDNIGSALLYQIQEQVLEYSEEPDEGAATSYQLYSPDIGKWLFVDDAAGNLYVDWQARKGENSKYFTLQLLENGRFRIIIHPENMWCENLPDYCIGWSPYQEDFDKNNYPLGTNTNLYVVPTEEDYATEWSYLTSYETEVFNCYRLRKQMYALYTEYADVTFDEWIYETYASTESSYDELSAAKKAMEDAVYGTAYDVTDLYLTNPRFESNVNGWTVDMPYAQNKGYQGASYSNGTIWISQFAEAWIDKWNGTLGNGSICQEIELPAGTYRLEADIIACNQLTGETVSGAALFVEGIETTTIEVHTGNEKPEHYALVFIHNGGPLNLGLRLYGTSANWVAIDNVQLYGLVTHAPTAIHVNPETITIVQNATSTLTATAEVEGNSYVYYYWSSADESIATVDERGHVTGHAAGTTTITTWAEGFDGSVETTVIVERNHPEYLIINEIQVANIDQFIDPSFNYGGWIELYNPTNTAIVLSLLTVSDNVGHLWQLPDDFGTLEPWTHRNLWFDHYDVKGGNIFSDQAYWQVPFKLQYEGGVITIADTDGNSVSQTYPAAIQRCSYARTTDGGDTWQWTSTPTPAARNEDSTFASTQLEAPVVDRDACVHTEGFDFNVTIPEGCTLYYTMDGRTPTLENAMSTTEGVFHVSDDETAIYRFRLFRDGYLPSPVVTRSFIYMDRDYYLPVISVVTDQANLYDDQIGAYTIGTNGIPGQGVSYNTNRNRSWERPVNFEYLVPEGNDDGGSFLMALNQECDFEVCGGWTRNLYSPNASFRLKGNKYYLGQNFLPYTFFEDKPYIKSKGIMVRNGGNDGYARIKDAGLHEIVLRSGFYLDCQTIQPAHVFVNGQYLMMFNIREPNNKNHAYSNYGIDTDEMDQFELNSVDGYVQKVGDFEVLKRWIDLSEELANNPTDDSIYEQICDIVDIDEYCNFMAAGCYVGCSDWFTNSNNVKGYRSRQDGKFHLVFMDQDAGFENTDMLGALMDRRHNYDSRYPYTNSNYLIDIFVNMLDYEPFRKKFIDAFCIVDGSVYEPAFSQQVFDEMVERAAPAMAMEGLDGNLRNSASEMVNRIRNNRSSRMANMSSRLGLWNEKNIKFSANVDCASFEINGQPVPRATFDGKLFEPATITAKAPAGYRFTGWQQGDGNVVTDSEQLFDTSADWHYYDQGPLDDEDWTSPDYAATDWNQSYAPFGYGNVGIGGSQDWNQQLDYGSDSADKRPTYYFRKSFNLDALPEENERYQLDCFVDDGFVVYINGEEFGRHLMDEGTPSYYSYSTTWEGSSAGHESLTLPSGSLRLGENVIAVEVHNTSASSSDIYWTAQLSHQTISAEGGVTFDSSELDIAQLSDGATLTATFERLADEELLADIATPIKVNEVGAGNTVFINDHFKKNDWIELYNTTDTDLDAAGLYLSDDLDDPLKYQIPSGTVANTIVPANGHLILWADKLESISQLHTPFKLGNANGQMALVTSSPEFVANNASYFEAHPALKDFADALSYNQHAGDQSVGRYPDGANEFYQMTCPTIERTNTHHSYDVLTGTDQGIMDLTNATFTLDLAEGWNWVSHPLTDAISVSAFDDYADRILGQTLEAYYSSSEHQMKGLLKRLTTGTLYKISMSEAHTYTFNGQQPATPTPIALHPGWNWIGYPLTAPQTLTEALATSKVDDGDVIIGLSGFAEYSSDDGWVGSLSSLTPGSGYLYRTSTTKAIRFKPSAFHIRLRKPLTSAQPSTTVCNRHAYPDVMAIIGRIENAEGQPVTTPFTLGAYANGECRGLSQVIDGRHFLSVHGQGGEMLTFKAFDETGAMYDVSQSMAFSADIAGTRKQPVAFTLAPVPTAIDIAMATTREAHPVAYYNLNGQLVTTNANALRSGFYVVRMSDGKCRKLMVK